MAKIMRLFDLSDEVQVSLKKSYNHDDDTFDATTTFMTSIEGATAEITLEGSFKEETDRDRMFNDMDKEKLTNIFNGIVDSQPFDIPKIETNGED